MGSAGLLAAALAVFVTAAHAQSYPAKPVRLIVPYAAGGPLDDAARIVGQRLTEIWGQAVVVDNRGGAGGSIGADVVAKSAPDGYTLLLGNAGPMTINPSLQKALPYDPQRDLAPITLVSASPMVLVVHPQGRNAVPGPDAEPLESLGHLSGVERDLAIGRARDAPIRPGGDDLPPAKPNFFEEKLR